jgi:hypothetical protein
MQTRTARKTISSVYPFTCASHSSFFFLEVLFLLSSLVFCFLVHVYQIFFAHNVHHTTRPPFSRIALCLDSLFPSIKNYLYSSCCAESSFRSRLACSSAPLRLQTAADIHITAPFGSVHLNRICPWHALNLLLVDVSGVRGQNSAGNLLSFIEIDYATAECLI